MTAVPTTVDNPSALLDALARQDFTTFVERVFPLINGGESLAYNWHLDAIAHALEEMRTGNVRRLAVNMPPRNLKSILISVAWVAWRLGHDPRLNFVNVSYSVELATKHARDCRSIMQSSLYKRLFPGTRISEKRSALHDFETTDGGGRLATSITGTLTGRGGDIIIIDDPIKPDEADSETTRKSVNEWFSSTLSSRLDDKGTGSIVVVMQRLHEDDLCGMLLGRGGWSSLSLPVIATEEGIIPMTRGRVFKRKIGDVLHPERESRKILEELKRSMGSARFEAQYQQSPIPAVGNMIQTAWLKYYDPEHPPVGGQIVQSWDTASKDGVHNDYSVCVTALVRHSQVYILNVWRDRVNFPDLLKAVTAVAERFRPNVLLIENAASGTQLFQVLRDRHFPFVPVPLARRPELDKVTRLAAVSAQIEAGKLFLPEHASWLEAFRHELLGFPNAKHDDEVDALAQLLAWVPIHSQADLIAGLPKFFVDGREWHPGTH